MTYSNSSLKIGRRAFVAGAAASFCAAGLVPARAQTQLKGVVELFTSQGCSSCPPADAALADFAQDRNVLALGYHVDYWDYLGWRDTLASSENTARQRAYAKALKSRTVYTPQAIVNGRVHLNGGKKNAIYGLMEEHRSAGTGLTVPVAVTAHSDRISVSVGAGDKPSGLDVVAVIAYFRDRSEVEIARGENAGRTMTYANAVMAMQTLGMWYGKPMTIDLPGDKIARNDATGCAVLLQATGRGGVPGAILGAAHLT